MRVPDKALDRVPRTRHGRSMEGDGEQGLLLRTQVQQCVEQRQWVEKLYQEREQACCKVLPHLHRKEAREAYADPNFSLTCVAHLPSDEPVGRDSSTPGAPYRSPSPAAQRFVSECALGGPQGYRRGFRPDLMERNAAPQTPHTPMILIERPRGSRFVEMQDPEGLALAGGDATSVKDERRSAKSGSHFSSASRDRCLPRHARGQVQRISQG